MNFSIKTGYNLGDIIMTVDGHIGIVDGIKIEAELIKIAGEGLDEDSIVSYLITLEKNSRWFNEEEILPTNYEIGIA
jgi:hypothetical protein